MNAVVAILVLSSVSAGVGAVGVPSSAGESSGAYTSSNNARINDTATCLADPPILAKTLSSAAMVCETLSSVIFLCEYPSEGLNYNSDINNVRMWIILFLY